MRLKVSDCYKFLNSRMLPRTDLMCEMIANYQKNNKDEKIGILICDTTCNKSMYVEYVKKTIDKHGGNSQNIVFEYLSELLKMNRQSSRPFMLSPTTYIDEECYSYMIGELCSDFNQLWKGIKSRL